MPFERVRAIKITIPRTRSSTAAAPAFDRDVYGAQQHGPLVGRAISVMRESLSADKGNPHAPLGARVPADAGSARKR
jgi:hypothetical protein